MSCDKFKMKQWKYNCLKMHESAVVIYKYLNNHVLNPDEINEKLTAYITANDSVDKNSLMDMDYYKYLSIFYWFKYLKENDNEKYSPSNFEENVDKFNLLYQENLKMYQSIDAKNGIKLTYERLTKHNINMYHAVEKDGSVSGIDEHNELFSDIYDLIDCINGTIYITDILNDVGYIYNDVYIFIPKCENPLTLKEFKTIENNPVKKLKNYTPDKCPVLKDVLDDYYRKIFLNCYNLSICYRMRYYFKRLADDFEIFINEELIKIAKTNYLNSK